MVSSIGANPVALNMPDRVGRIFSLLMQLRVLLAAMAIVLMPSGQSVFNTLSIVGAVAVLSWLCARFWPILLPHVLSHPSIAAADVCLAFAILALGYAEGPIFFFTLVTACAAGLLFRARGAAAVCLLQMGCYYWVLATHEYDMPTDVLKLLLVQPLYYPITGFVGVMLRKFIDEQMLQEKALRQVEVVAASAEERSRLAREMHDSLAKTLRGIALNAEALPLWVVRDQERAIKEAERISAATEIAAREARELMAELRTDTVMVPLPELVCSVSEHWAAEQGAELDCETDARADLPLTGRYEALAVLREALQNIERHACASRIRISLTAELGEVVMFIQDNGAGFDDSDRMALARAGHFGLIGMGERVERVGGSFALVSQLGLGTTVTARFPLAATEPLIGGTADVRTTSHGRR